MTTIKTEPKKEWLLKQMYTAYEKLKDYEKQSQNEWLCENHMKTCSLFDSFMLPTLKCAPEDVDKLKRNLEDTFLFEIPTYRLGPNVTFDDYLNKLDASELKLLVRILIYWFRYSATIQDAEELEPVAQKAIRLASERLRGCRKPSKRAKKKKKKRV